MGDKNAARGGDGAAWDLVIAHARLLDRDGTADVAVKDGRIGAIESDIGDKAAHRIDARGGMVTPSFVEPHFHLDKCLSRELLGALSPEEAFARAVEAKTHFTVADVEARASRALDLAVSHGIGRMRAQCDVDFATKLVSFEGLLRARERYRHAIDIEIVAFPQEGTVKDAEAPGLMREALAMGADAVGGLPECELSVEDQRAHVATVLDIAEAADVPVEMHCDYMDLPELQTLEMLADVTAERGYLGRVTASHCNALSVYPDVDALRLMEKLLTAEVGVTVLPVANLQMLGGPHRTPHNRGSSRVKELLDLGINVCAGSDSMYDIWYRFNRLDPVETSYISCLSAAMRTDDEVRAAFDMVTTRAAKAVGASDRGVALGEAADLVVHEATSLIDVMRNLPGQRIHFKGGRRVGGLERASWVADGA